MYRAAVGCTHTSSGQRRLATFAAKGRCTRCTCLACTSTCASRGDFPYKSPDFRLISVDSARLVHRITVPLKFPRTNQTCTTSAQLPHKVRATHLPPVPVHRREPCEDLGNAACGDGHDNPLTIKTLQDHNPQTPTIFCRPAADLSVSNY